MGQLELKLLLAMDAAYVRALNKKADDKPGGDEIIDVEEIGMTPELFDALFIAGSNDNVLKRNTDG